MLLGQSTPLANEEEPSLIAVSPAAVRAIETAHLLCGGSRPILIIGKRGTGKDSFAQLIHKLQHRQRFVKVDCAECEDVLRRSLLGYFDHLRAELALDPDVEAYEPGSLDEADEGTIYLDRIHLAPETCVSLLLDILTGKPYHPISSNRVVSQGDIQFIASCEPDPFSDPPEGYLNPRLRAIFGERVLLLPGLRDRQADIPRLVELFSAEMAPTVELRFSNDFFGCLDQCEWPGNLSDLRTVVRRVIARLPDGGHAGASVAREVLGRLSSRPAEPAEYARRRRCGALAEGLVYQGVGLDADRAYAWIEQFSPYRCVPSVDPRDVAEQLLRAVHSTYYYSNTRVKHILTTLFSVLVDDVRHDTRFSWLRGISEEKARLLLLRNLVLSNPLGPMKSPDAIHLMFREVSGAVPTRNAVDFARLPKRIRDGNDLVVVFLDDFIGTGEQFRTAVIRDAIVSNVALRTAMQSKKTGKIRFFALVCVAYEEGLRAATLYLEQAVPWLDVTILAGDVLHSDSKIFSPASNVFANEAIRQGAEEIVVQQIGAKLYPGAPGGRGALQSLVVFEHNIPNSSLPVLWKDGHVDERPWRPLFPRMRSG